MLSTTRLSRARAAGSKMNNDVSFGEQPLPSSICMVYVPPERFSQRPESANNEGISPGCRVNVSVPVPPVAPAAIIPLLSPLHEIESVYQIFVICISGGDVTSTVATASHPRASVTVTEYIPSHSRTVSVPFPP